MNVFRPFVRSVLKRCTNEHCDVKYWEMCKQKNHLACPSADRRVLGRWQHQDDNKQVAIKVNYANVDHCGPCGIDEMRTVIDVKDKI
jgi:hypothetical protein